MNTTTTHILRRTALAIALPLALAAPAHATVGGPVSNVPERSAAEGTVLKLPVTGTCPTFTSCLYTVTTGSGTATKGVDFTSPTWRKRIKRNRKLKRTLAVKIVQDDVCEGDETFTVRLAGQGAGSLDQFFGDFTQTITDDDCDEAGTTEPEADPGFPADSGTPTETTTQLSNGTMKECRTPFWLGTTGGSGNWGSYNKGCSVKIQCPVTARVCKASSETAINLERNNGQRVTMNSRMWAFSSSDTPFWHRDLSCAATNFCRNEDSVMIRGGEYMVSQCNGVRETTDDNRSSVRCSLVVETQS